MSKAKNKQVKTEVEQKPGEAGAEVTAGALAKQEENKEGLRVDPTIEQLETEKAKEIAAIRAEAKAEIDAIRAEAAKKTESDQVDVSKPKGAVAESADLEAAVKADAKARKKTCEKCLVTGVLVVK